MGEGNLKAKGARPPPAPAGGGGRREREAGIGRDREGRSEREGLRAREERNEKTARDRGAEGQRAEPISGKGEVGRAGPTAAGGHKSVLLIVLEL